LVLTRCGVPGGAGCDILEERNKHLSRIKFLVGLLALSLTIGCRAQANGPSGQESDLNRRIEVMVRAQFGVPAEVSVELGKRTPSQIPGFDTIPVTLSRGPSKKEIDFLISADNQKLARLETFDLTKNPIFNIDVAGRPIRGNPVAKVTVINFDDLECPYCARMHASLFPDTMDRYRDKVRFIYKDDPLTDMHPWAMHAAVDANCLAAQNGDTYWKFVDYVHSHGQEVTGDQRDLKKSFATLDRITREEATLAKLDTTKVDACLSKQDEAAVKASEKEAEALDIEGTPALFVNGERINGALPEEEVWMVIDRALRAAGVEPPPTPPPAAHPADASK
jgi:protein-disulfide isomerase